MIPGDVHDLDHPPLRRDRRREVQRTAAAHGDRRPRRLAAHPAHARLARVAGGAIAIPATLALTLLVFYLLRLHAEPHHAVRADLLDRHPGRRRDRGGREHRAPLPSARERRRARSSEIAVRSGGRGRQPDHPRDVRGDRRGPADGVRGRADGAVHAADPDRRVARRWSSRCRRLHRHALGGGRACSEGGAAPRRRTRDTPAGARTLHARSIAGSWRR